MKNMHKLAQLILS